jgi:hypothetical protein
MEQSPSSEANSLLAPQIPYLLWYPKVHCHFHNSPPVSHILSLTVKIKTIL